MLYRLRRFAETRSQLWIRRIHRTAPLERAEHGPIFVSQLAAVYLDMYLLAVKSVGIWIKPSRCIVLSDGSLKPSHLRILRHHIPGIDVRDVDSVDVGHCPQGGCWERLVTCITESASAFVMQIDSDTVTYARPDAVLQCIRENRSFTMSGCLTDANDSSTRLMSRSEAADARRAEAAQSEHPHVQIAAETVLPRLPDAMGNHYIRGSAGYAGFGRGAITIGALEAFSTAMAGQIGPRWTEWGTEQVASNFVIANSSGGTVLPWPDYAGQKPGLPETHVMVHFTGEHRFGFGTYRRVGTRAMVLMSPSP